MSEPAGLTRRGLLAGAAAAAGAALAGCGRVGSSTSGVAGETPTDSDRGRVERALRDEQATLVAYRQVAAAHRSLRADIDRLETVQRRHVQSLADALGTDVAGRLPAPASQTSRLPAARAEIAQLASRMRDGRLRDCLQADSGAAASLMAALAASHATVAATWGGEPR